MGLERCLQALVTITTKAGIALGEPKNAVKVSEHRQSPHYTEWFGLETLGVADLEVAAEGQL